MGLTGLYGVIGTITVTGTGYIQPGLNENVYIPITTIPPSLISPDYYASVIYEGVSQGDYYIKDVDYTGPDFLVYAERVSPNGVPTGTYIFSSGSLTAAMIIWGYIDPSYVGATGVQGVTGLSGSNGSLGAIGNTGAQGSTGLRGYIGLTGVTGLQGATGVDLGPNYVGATGVDLGPNYIGETGIRGETGLRGPIGYNGLTGVTGLSIQGATGCDIGPNYVGATGPQGVTGIWPGLLGGVSGTFKTLDKKTITVTNGVITHIENPTYY